MNDTSLKINTDFSFNTTPTWSVRYYEVEITNLYDGTQVHYSTNFIASSLEEAEKIIDMSSSIEYPNNNLYRINLKMAVRIQNLNGEPDTQKMINQGHTLEIRSKLEAE